MCRGKALACALGWAILSMPAFFESSIAMGQSLSSPVPIGVTGATTVDNQDIFDPSPPSDVKITVLEIARAERAWDLIREASTSNRQSESDFDYVLVRIKFDYYAREGTAKDKTYELRKDELVAASSEGNWYKIPEIVLPKPNLKTRLRSGESSEGWVAFLVPHGDKKPLMFFQRGGIWFELY